MKIKKVTIENFRSYRQVEIDLNKYTSFVGPNGAGKSTVLCALNIFFREQDSSITDTAKLIAEDFFVGETENSIKITVTFDELNDKAQKELSDYVRANELVVTAQATFDPVTNCAQVRHFGQRLGMTEFKVFFEAVKANSKAEELNKIYSELQEKYKDLPPARSKEAKAEALRSYESKFPEKCTLIPSEDNFYGIDLPPGLLPTTNLVHKPSCGYPVSPNWGAERVQSKTQAMLLPVPAAYTRARNVAVPCCNGRASVRSGSLPPARCGRSRRSAIRPGVCR